MRILYIVPWSASFNQTDLCEIVNSQFGYYTMKNENVDITWCTHDREGFVYKICKFLRMPQINQIFSQLSIIGKEGEYDLIYVGFDMHLLPLAIFKLIGLVKKPIFVLSHFSYNTKYTDSKWKKFFKSIERKVVYKAFERISFACDTLLNLAKDDYNVPQRHWNVANWGGNMCFFDRNIYNKRSLNKYFVAAGGMNRDYSTLIKAFKKLPNEHVRIYAKYRDYTESKSIPANVVFGNLMKDKSLVDAYKALRDEYYNAIAILLPIDYINDVPNGATVLVEALAMGKPVIVTEAETNYIDVEKEGCGITVKRHDVEGWISAVKYLRENPDKVKEMGEKAYLLARDKYNDKLFVMNILHQMNDMLN